MYTTIEYENGMYKGQKFKIASKNLHWAPILLVHRRRMGLQRPTISPLFTISDRVNIFPNFLSRVNKFKSPNRTHCTIFRPRLGDEFSLVFMKEQFWTLNITRSSVCFQTGLSGTLLIKSYVTKWAVGGRNLTSSIKPICWSPVVSNWRRTLSACSAGMPRSVWRRFPSSSLSKVPVHE